MQQNNRIKNREETMVTYGDWNETDQITDEKIMYNAGIRQVLMNCGGWFTKQLP